MKRIAPWFVLLLAVIAWSQLRPQAGAPVSDTRVAYQCPMHPWVKAAQIADCTICGMKLVAQGATGSQSEAPRGSVMLPRGSARVMGLTTATVTNRPLQRTLRVTGMIGEDMSRHGVISAPVEGRIDGLAMSCEGERITRRQPLVTLFSRTLLAAANDYRQALTNGGPTQETTHRALLQFGLVHEQILTIPTRQPDDAYFGLLATLSGTIVKSYVAEGQYVKAGEKLFEIADFTKMWFMFPVYEQDLSWVRVGQTVRLTSPSLPGESFSALITFISPNLDETTRSAQVRVVLENPERRLKNNTLAAGVVELEAPIVLAVPRSAVLWSGSPPRVFVATAPGVYEPRAVRLGRTGDTDWEVLAGLAPGEEVVLAGNLLLDSQAQMDQLAVPAAGATAPPAAAVVVPPAGIQP